MAKKGKIFKNLCKNKQNLKIFWKRASHAIERVLQGRKGGWAHTFFEKKKPFGFFRVCHFTLGNSRQNKASPLKIPQNSVREHWQKTFVTLSRFWLLKGWEHSCSDHSNLEMEAECLTKNLLYLNLNISRTKNGRNNL